MQVDGGEILFWRNSNRTPTEFLHDANINDAVYYHIKHLSPITSHILVYYLKTKNKIIASCISDKYGIT